VQVVPDAAGERDGEEGAGLQQFDEKTTAERPLGDGAAENGETSGRGGTVGSWRRGRPWATGVDGHWIGSDAETLFVARQSQPESPNLPIGLRFRQKKEV